MLDVFLTFDTEVWISGWRDLDARFPEAFRSYVYGPTPQGDGALPLIMNILDAHGLTGVFFVEPLFSRRFGIEPLAEIVGLLQERGHEVQVHLHTEWADETSPPLLPHIDRKHQHLAMFDRAAQRELIGIGIAQLNAAGAGPLRAFRAGNYALNEHTPGAVAAAGLDIDSSYNPTSPFGAHFAATGSVPLQAFAVDGVIEYPISIFADGGADRALQLTACSWGEIRAALQQAVAQGWESLIIVAHNFELMNRAKTRIDPIVRRRFEQLCTFLAHHPDRFRVRGFNGLDARPFNGPAQPLKGNTLRRTRRLGEQFVRRLYGA